ncbi:peptide ABC transporter substrate-binding protein [Streptomyces palmae]|uniref:ABC transporter substrate-binding protein n=1 Tax=Streptomyces palmae TaxID=1701085 RepID=A0A4Z0HCP2_9ACTN|nr:ABC transporter substrate-binding protein [Streptomyces palmae]TGB09306.1 ABC transporter substrate-binding protein [Streptomyces palmae]
MRGASSAKWVAMAAVVALAATACGGDDDKDDKGGSSSGGGIVSASWTDPQKPIEPANVNEVQGGKVLDMIFTGLMEYDPKTAEAKPAMAESIETKDQQNFTIKVKKGWTFSNGEKVTAKSYVDAWNYGALIDNAQLSASFFQDIEGYADVHPEAEGAKAKAKTMSGLKLKDDYTFTVKLSKKFSTWPQHLGYKAFSPLPEAFFKEHDAWLKKPIGNGPYKVDSYKKGTGMKLSVNKTYAGEDKPVNKGVELKVYTDFNTAYNDVMAGNLDVIDDVPAGQLANVDSDMQGRYINQPAGIVQTITFPLYKKDSWGTKDAIKVRHGLSMAINREQITDKIFSKTRTPAKDYTSPVLKTGGYSEDICGEYCTYNPSKAKKLIEEGGGIPGGKMVLSSNVDTGSHKLWMDAVCNSINNVLGKKDACTVNPVGTFGDFRDQITKREMNGPFRAGWQMDYPLIDNFLTPLYKTKASSNDGEYSNKDFDKLLDQANAEPDTAKAIKLYQDAEKLLVKDMPSIPLWYQNGSAAYSDRVENVALNPFSVPVYQAISVK